MAAVNAATAVQQAHAILLAGQQAHAILLDTKANASQLGAKADAVNVTAAFLTKADTVTVTLLLSDKADQSDLDALAGTVSGKAESSVVDALGLSVASKADASALGTLSSTVSGKAGATAVTSLSDDLIALTSTVGHKANATDVTVLMADNADTAAVSVMLADKADTAAVTVLLADKADTAAVTVLLADKADTAAVMVLMAEKADTTALAALNSVVAGMADQAEVTAVSARLNASLVSWKSDEYSRVSRDSVVFEETVYEKYLAPLGDQNDSPGRYYLTLAGNGPDFRMGPMLSIGYYRHVTITSEVTDATLTFAATGCGTAAGSGWLTGIGYMPGITGGCPAVAIASTGKLTLNGTYASISFLRSVRLDEGVSLTVGPSLQRLNFGVGWYYNFITGATWSRMFTLGADAAFVVDDTAGSVTTLGPSLLWLAALRDTEDNEGSVVIRGLVQMVTAAGASLGTITGELPGQLDLTLTADGQAHFGTSVASGSITRAADGTETSDFGWVSAWDSGETTNYAGNTFTLFKLPAFPFTDDAAGLALYQSSCQAAGLLTVGPGYTSYNQGTTYQCSALGSGVCMPLPCESSASAAAAGCSTTHGAGEWGTSDHDDKIHLHTGWRDFVVQHTDSNQRPRFSQCSSQNGCGSAYMSTNTLPLSPICAKEH